MLDAFVGMLVVYGSIIVVAQLTNYLGKTKLPH